MLQTFSFHLKWCKSPFKVEIETKDMHNRTKENTVRFVIVRSEKRVVRMSSGLKSRQVLKNKQEPRDNWQEEVVRRWQPGVGIGRKIIQYWELRALGEGCREQGVTWPARSVGVSQRWQETSLETEAETSWEWLECQAEELRLCCEGNRKLFLVGVWLP